MTVHPLVAMIDADTLSVGWQSVDEIVAWLSAATPDERLEAYAALRERPPERFRWMHRGRQIALAGTARTTKEVVEELEDVSSRQAEQVADVLALRPKPWLEEFVTRWVDTAPRSARAIVDVLVARGLVARPTSIGYVRAMTHGLSPSPHPDDIRARLLSEPTTAGADVVTMLTAPDVGRVLYLADGRFGPFRVEENTWIWQIALLVDEGVVDRATVLDICLRELDRPAEREAAIWFTAMWHHLEPGPEDCVPQVSALLRLLHVDRATTVALAQLALLPLVRADRVEARALLDSSPAPLNRGEKKVVLSQLRLIDMVGAQHPGLRPAVVELARIALQHSRADVQDAALRIIAKHGDLAGLSDTDREAISPALADRTGDAAVASGRADVELAACVEQIAALPVAVRSRWHLDEALQQARAGVFPRLAAPPPSIGTPLGTVTDDPAEVAALLGELSERETDPLEWFGTLAAAVRTASVPVAQRAAAWRPYRRRGLRQGVFNFYLPAPQTLVEMVAAAWSGERQFPRPANDVYWLPNVIPLVAAECAFLISAGHGTQLLSEPTHTSGTIDPAALLDRLAGLTPEHPDLDIELAAMRLPRALDERFWDDARQRDVSTADRLRRQYERQEPPAIEVWAVTSKDEWGRTVSTVEVEANPSTLGAEPGVWTALTDVRRRNARGSHYGGRLFDSFAWGWNVLAPWHPDLVAAHLVASLRSAMDHHNTQSPAPRSAAELDARLGVLGPTGHVALVLGLQGGTATTRTPAADVWFAAAADGRLDPEQVADALVMLHSDGQLRLNRFIESVAPTTADPVVAARTLCAIASAAPRLLEAKARHLHLLFELAAELAARIGVDLVPDPLREDVASRSSSALAVARRRLANVPPDGAERFTAAAGALQALLDRIEVSSVSSREAP